MLWKQVSERAEGLGSKVTGPRRSGKDASRGLSGRGRRLRGGGSLGSEGEVNSGSERGDDLKG